MDESRMIKMRALQERIEREEYEVDPRKVADAIVARLSSPKANGGACGADSPGRRNPNPGP
jgi:hypothetical protein